MIQFEEWEKESLTKAHINYAHDCWKAAQESILTELEREIEARMKIIEDAYNNKEHRISCRDHIMDACGECIRYRHNLPELRIVLSRIRFKKGDRK
jgi:hypothetical protein